MKTSRSAFLALCKPLTLGAVSQHRSRSGDAHPEGNEQHRPLAKGHRRSDEDRTIIIDDTPLRDGEQSAAVAFSLEEKIDSLKLASLSPATSSRRKSRISGFFTTSCATTTSLRFSSNPPKGAQTL